MFLFALLMLHNFFFLSVKFWYQIEKDKSTELKSGMSVPCVSTMDRPIMGTCSKYCSCLLVQFQAEPIHKNRSALTAIPGS